MKAENLIIKCYAEKIDNQWQALCLDFSLAAQGDTFEEAQQKLEQMLAEYVHDALVGEDKEFAFSLLRRKAPIKYWLKFYYLVALSKIGALQGEVKKLFCPPLPLELRNYNHV